MSSDTNESAADTDTPVSAFESSLVLVSNRQPYSHRYEDDEIVVDRPVGGLTAGLDPVMQQVDGTWIAWGDGDADAEVTDDNDCVRVPPEDPSYTLRRVWLSDEAVDEYYYGYSNQVLWPLCHDLVGKTNFEDRFWSRYQEVNEQFADAVVEQADEESVVWFQDYHLALAPSHAREALPETTLFQFWHIPWPTWDTFRVCPHREELLGGLLANDLIGFHTERYVENFLACVDACFEAATVDTDSGEVEYDGETTLVRAFPLGVDAERIGELAGEREETFWPEFKREYSIPDDSRVAVGVDRLDYTKGIPERLDALEELFETRPEWRERLTYVQKSTESRSDISEYQRLQSAVDERIERLNERFATESWRPVVRIEEHLTNPELYGLYAHSDLALVTPVRDGMNLVAKEYVAAQADDDTKDGVLVLSRMTGAHGELGDTAVTIEPYDAPELAGQIEEALTMPDHERKRRMDALRASVLENDLDTWLASLLGTVQGLRRMSTQDTDDRNQRETKS
ncbi:trehalose-6-phosphate synthase [Haloprofundus marisrubri]|uniref:Trehalose-6-phosphate synthase n=1 Tax=Haloprofundus marisrubri TaxID=1514971 RepID=A0A0W1RD56_9EURY|nr:trehalose-6-phosphate synthase [Haloprofundus marisrubri]KTG11637.1 trehalose-6-phosphate synthase [Haloprofundus marisrubri]